MDVTKLTFEEKTKYTIQQYRKQISTLQIKAASDLKVELNNAMKQLSEDHDLGYDSDLMYAVPKLFSSLNDTTFYLYHKDNIHNAFIVISKNINNDYVSNFNHLKMVDATYSVSTLKNFLNMEHELAKHHFGWKLATLIINDDAVIFNSYFKLVKKLHSLLARYFEVQTILNNLENSLKELDSY
jgi:hypothetical protein